jgi:hypothetical protein
MNRRLFFGVVGCFVGALPFGVRAIPPNGENVKLVRYVDSALIGRTFKLVSAIEKPRHANEHYRTGEQVYRVTGHGLHLDVYADEIAAI